ncbi:MAG: hypothetical protein CM1200mP14_05760 [Gammaproteobacteria bacterium]|nr:MAG: hypothetical protein CM1200mP14_05760 [Gammaproteobacteria bacterium]
MRANWSKAKSRRLKRRVGAVCPGLLGLAFYVLTIGTPISQAQVIRGTVRDARTAEPVMLLMLACLHRVGNLWLPASRIDMGAFH